MEFCNGTAWTGYLQSPILAYANDYSSQHTNGIGGSHGNCVAGNVGPETIFPNETATFTLTTPRKVLVRYSSMVSKGGAEPTGSGFTWIIVNGGSRTRLTVDSLTAGFAQSHVGSFVTNTLSAGSHTVSIKHTVDCGTVFWANRVLTVELLP